MAGIVGAGVFLALALGAASMSDGLTKRIPECAGTAHERAFAWKVASGPQAKKDPAAVPLFEAIIDGDETGLRRLLESGTSTELRLYPGGWSALMVAAQIGCPVSVRLLLEHGADVNYLSDGDDADTALGVALTYGVWDGMSIFYALLDHGAKLETKFPNDTDVVIHAATLGQMKLVNELLDRGYRSDLPGLLETLEIIHVNEETEPYKQRAMERVKALIHEK
ncbi:hypothetical protein PbB2_02406 [Candidatus Phycosocius bacilliformis]|uniref:Uncharacterized protein n=1 Tax=Candidatus Phycosocius bacilliformis TaxID=1445552 RepID=A0A2P2ECC1_9PROT|nr:ankyrin repeat domain-containing protein [Candidatus Phycosocius bacilliformis]GBF58718.1 hypothetical protein PbB2_02406 [Candidatus Phycosocius bacilliformis]